jgi:hypothetical protein
MDLKDVIKSVIAATPSALEKYEIVKQYSLPFTYEELLQREALRFCEEAISPTPIVQPVVQVENKTLQPSQLPEYDSLLDPTADFYSIKNKLTASPFFNIDPMLEELILKYEGCRWEHLPEKEVNRLTKQQLKYYKRFSFQFRTFLSYGDMQEKHSSRANGALMDLLREKGSDITGQDIDALKHHVSSGSLWIIKATYKLWMKSKNFVEPDVPLNDISSFTKKRHCLVEDKIVEAIVEHEGKSYYDLPIKIKESFSKSDRIKYTNLSSHYRILLLKGEMKTKPGSKQKLLSDLVKEKGDNISIEDVDALNKSNKNYNFWYMREAVKIWREWR